MTNHLTPFEVAPYSPDFITNVIRYVTRWASRGEVVDKAHVAYLNNYLRHLDVKTVVFESEYIDRHYLEDYSEYYARCFQPLPKTCARLHFFKTEFREEDLADCINNKVDQTFLNKFIQKKGAYVGFVVIRPLPFTCIARMCLKPYDFDGSAVILQSKVNVSFFGIDLTVDTVAFIEQDKVVSACATSAIWAFLNANQTFKSELLPSPSAITKSALATDSGGRRVFPAATGLQVDHVCRSLKAYGLEPTVIAQTDYDDERFIDKVKGILSAYLPSRIPVLMGGTVIQLHEDGGREHLGEHLVCALGYKADKNVGLAVPAEINRIYVHDDRYGPYVSLTESETDQEALCFELKQQVDGEGDRSVRRELFEPKVLIIGLYHKIRIDFDYAYNVCGALWEVVSNYLEHFSGERELCYKEFIEFAKCRFQVSLCYSTDLKAEFIRERPKFFSFNGTDEPAAFLTANMPKYVWRCRFLSKRKRFADILLDATGIPQGDLVLGCLAYTVQGDAFWRTLSKFVRTPYYKDVTTELEQGVQSVTSCITRFFFNFDDNYLDAHYGPVRLPARQYRATEVDDHGDQITRPDTIKIVRGNNAKIRLEYLNKEVTYIWVIDQFGDIIIGDEPTFSSSKMGHPALTGGGPARLAGELIYCHRDGVWEINARSGTYSAYLRKSPETANRYLDSVIRNNLDGCKVRKQPPQ